MPVLWLSLLVVVYRYKMLSHGRENQKQDKYLVQHRTCLSTLLTMFIRSHFHQLTLQITKHKKSMSAKEELEQNGNLKVLKPNLPPEVLTHVNISLYTPTKQSMHY